MNPTDDRLKITVEMAVESRDAVEIEEDEENVLYEGKPVVRVTIDRQEAEYLMHSLQVQIDQYDRLFRIGPSSGGLSLGKFLKGP